MPDILNFTSRVSHGHKVLTAEAGDDVIMMSVDQDLFCGLDDIGSDIWRRLAQPVKIADLCDALAADYRGDREQMALDVLELLSLLHARGLIDVA